MTCETFAICASLCRVLHMHNLFKNMKNWMKKVFIIPISQIRKLGHREVKYLVWGHTAIQRKSLFQCYSLV